ncbi:AI-2E family transporter [Candidatus Saccharibacteria bacterium]|nr:AI-2E family transporter [Candidatus Saccharibacteria bacterium]
MEATQKISITKWHVALLVALLFGVYFLRDFLGVIALAALMAYVFNPIYKRLLKLFRNRKGASATTTIILSFFILGIPVALIIGITIAQATTLINNMQQDFVNNPDTSLTNIVNDLVNQVNSVTAPFTHNPATLQTQDVLGYLRSILPDIASTLVQLITVTIGSMPRFIMYAVAYIFVLVAFFVYQEGIINGIKTISPFSKSINDKYFRKVGAMTSAMVKGQFIIAFAQGTVSAAALAVVGLKPYFFFFWVLFTFLSFIPLGAGIITIPLGIIMLLTGNIWQGLLILGNHFIIVTNIDNVRPKLVPKDAYMPAALTLLAAFAGVAHFGFLGVVYGPIIMILIVTTIETYVEISKAGNLEKS